MPAPVELKMYVFTVGDILVKDISQFSPGIDEGLSKQFTNSAYLIRHEKGDLIWDTGLPDGLNQNPDGNDAGNFVMKMPKTLSSQLQEIGLDPSEVDYLGLSHLMGHMVMPICSHQLRFSYRKRSMLAYLKVRWLILMSTR